MNDFIIDCISMINYNLSNTGVKSQALTTPNNFHFWISDLSITSSISSSIYTFPEWSSLHTALVPSQLLRNRNDRARNTVVFTIFMAVDLMSWISPSFPEQVKHYTLNLKNKRSFKNWCFVLIQVTSHVRPVVSWDISSWLMFTLHKLFHFHIWLCRDTRGGR